MGEALMVEAKVKRFGNYYGITDGTKWFHYYYHTEGQAQTVLETADYFRNPLSHRVNISYDQPAKLVGPDPETEDLSSEDLKTISAQRKSAYERGLAEAPKECKGKAAARALAVMVLDPRIKDLIWQVDPKALQQAKKALEPFGYPDTDALREKLGLRVCSHEDTYINDRSETVCRECGESLGR